MLGGFLSPDLSGGFHEISALALAHVGDAVFELGIRTWLCTQGASTAKGLHGKAVGFVSAKAQSAAARRILPVLSGEELAVFKRGRNAHVNSVPRGSTFEEYHLATAVEAVFGYLYLSGKTGRLDELFGLIVNE